MNRYLLGLLSLGFAVVFAACATTQTNDPLPSPRLILQITVDQLRGDLPTRHFDQFGDGGFRYLWEQGAVYTDAYHNHANNETIVGHTTLATGATPAAHGMIGNTWLDRETGETVYNIEDARFPLLTAGAGVDQETEIDPTQRAARSEGRSPSAILVSTFSDELAAYTSGQAKVFAVSVKDRGAVSMAGHAGKAFWFSKASGQFVTSSYYFDRYPDWVNEWNQQDRTSRYGDTQWQLLHPQDTYLFGDSDDRPWETDLAGFGRTFPHPWGSADSKYYTTLLTVSPAGDELTLDFAKALIENERLGDDGVPDYLGVSFSSTDYVGHLFGPSSLEAEDNILRLDRVLAELLAYVDEKVGLEHTLIVLSADHGGPDAPGYSKSLGIPGGYVDPESWDRESAIARLKQEFNIDGELIEKYQHPYVYLSPQITSRSDAERELIERAVAEELARKSWPDFPRCHSPYRAVPLNTVICRILSWSVPCSGISMPNDRAMSTSSSNPTGLSTILMVCSWPQHTAHRGVTTPSSPWSLPGLISAHSGFTGASSRSTLPERWPPTSESDLPRGRPVQSFTKS